MRISELKNGFYGLTTENDTGEYRDLKVIYEITYPYSDTVVSLESQLNLDHLLKWKEAEHIV